MPVEEAANTITHGLGLALSVAGFVMLGVLAGMRGEPLLIIGCMIYGASLVVLYGASTVYHGTRNPELKNALRILDHCCIYLLIAGSYTPFGLLIADGSFGVSLLAAFWVLAGMGIIVKLIFRERFAAVTVTSYVLMGWLGVFALQPLFVVLGFMPIILAISGGIAYTLGVVFFPWKSIRHHHAIFHVFVLLGSILHYAAVVMYVVPFADKV